MANTKFKVGDKVRVKTGLIADEHYDGLLFNGSMTKYEGKTAVIKRYTYNNRYALDVDCGEWAWNDEMLTDSNAFTKLDLKDGMVVEYRSGERALHLDGRLMSLKGGMPLSSYEYDLTRRRFPVLRTHDGKPMFDIMKVYKTSACGCITRIFDTDNLTLIWERKEEPDYKEMTVEQIEEKLGYKIKVVGNDA
jgi:hypothetical protein